MCPLGSSAGMAQNIKFVTNQHIRLSFWPSLSPIKFYISYHNNSNKADMHMLPLWKVLTSTPPTNEKSIHGRLDPTTLTLNLLMTWLMSGIKSCSSRTSVFSRRLSMASGMKGRTSVPIINIIIIIMHLLRAIHQGYKPARRR